MKDELATEPASPWAEKFWDEAKERGIVDGTRPQSAVTRQEAAIMVVKMIPSER